MSCQYFALCDEEAIGTVKNPVLGNVPCCARCADRVGMTLDFDPENPHPELLPEPPAGWHSIYDNVVVLTAHLADHGHNGAAVAAAVEKPWNYTDEYKLAVWEAAQ